MILYEERGDVKEMRRKRMYGMEMKMCDYEGRNEINIEDDEGNIECVNLILEKWNVK